MTPEQTGSTPPPSEEANEDRRKFLATCGKFAIVTPPAITMLLSTSLNSEAVAHSSGGGGRDNGGNGRDRDRDWWNWFDWLWDNKPWRR